MKPEWILTTLLALLFCFVTIVSGEKLPTITVTISDKLKVEAELAYTDTTRARGMMFRKELPADAGMLFIFPDLDYHSFWMKNTFIPLDLLWLNEQKEIVYFLTAEPCQNDPCDSYLPMQKAKYVLELQGGYAKKHELKIGQRLDFDIPAEVENIVNKRIGF